MNKKDVIKHSSAIQISNKISLLQRRAWNVLLANAFDELDKTDTYKVSIQELAKVLSFDSNNIQYLKDILKELNVIQVEWNLLNKDSKAWGVFTLLAEANIINGYCYYSYAPTLRQNLYNPSMYARISLSLQNQFKSKYALALFELFVDYFQTQKGYGETPWMSLDTFRELMGIKDYEYKEFKRLKEKVVKEPIKEINTITDLYIDEQEGILTKTEGRKVVALKFIIRKNKQNIIDIQAIEKKECAEQVCLPVPEFEIDNQELLNTLTVEFNLPNQLAVQILQSQDEYQINQTLTEIRKKIALSENILSASDLALKAFFPQKNKKAPPPVDEIEKRLQAISYHAFKKVRKLHSDQVLLDALKELDFEIEKRKKTGVKIENIAGWLNARLPESGKPYQFSVPYQKMVKAELEKQQARIKREQEAIKQADILKQQEEQKKALRERIEAKLEELRNNPDEWEPLNQEALKKAQSKITPPDQSKELNNLATTKIQKLSKKELQELEKEAIEFTQSVLGSLNIDYNHPAFQNAKENQKVSVVKIKYSQELNEALHTTPAYINYQQKIVKQTELEIRDLVKTMIKSV